MDKKSEQVKRFSVRFPLDLLAEVKNAAQEDERPINSEIVWLIRQALALRKGEKKPDAQSL